MVINGSPPCFLSQLVAWSFTYALGANLNLEASVIQTLPSLGHPKQAQWSQVSCLFDVSLTGDQRHTRWLRTGMARIVRSCRCHAVPGQDIYIYMYIYSYKINSVEVVNSSQAAESYLRCWRHTKLLIYEFT